MKTRSILLITAALLSCLHTLGQDVPPPNQVLSLDGDGDYVAIPSDLGLQNPTGFTVELWLNPRLPRGRYVSKSDGQSGQSSRSYEISSSTDGSLVLDFFWEVVPGKPDFSTIATTIAAHQWTHVAAVFSSDLGKFQVFTNGVLAAEDSTLAGRTLRQTTLPLLLGWTDPFTETYANGSMDEVRVWKVARSPEEIYGDRFCTLTGTEPNLAGYWTFDDRTVKDSTGHGHDGTFTGNAHAEIIQGSDEVHSGQCGQLLPHYIIDDQTPGGGVVLLEPFQSSFAKNSFVNLTAHPANGWTFLDWKGNTQGTDPVITLQITDDKKARARFGTTVKVASAGGGTVTVISASTLYPYGTTVRLVAQPQSGQYFTGWSGSATGDSNPLTYVVRDGNPVMTASFATLPDGKQALTVTPDGHGRTSVTPHGNAHTSGLPVTITAIPDNGQDFLGWSGDATGKDNPLVVTMDQSRVITASFSRRPHLEMESLGVDGLLLTLSGEPSAPYRILRSIDLSTWDEHLMLTTRYGEAQIIEPASGDQRSFYGAVAP